MLKFLSENPHSQEWRKNQRREEQELCFNSTKNCLISRWSSRDFLTLKTQDEDYLCNKTLQFVRNGIAQCYFIDVDSRFIRICIFDLLFSPIEYSTRRLKKKSSHICVCSFVLILKCVFYPSIVCLIKKKTVKESCWKKEFLDDPDFKCEMIKSHKWKTSNFQLWCSMWEKHERKTTLKHPDTS